MLEKHLVHALIGRKDPYRCLAWLRGSLVFTPVVLTRFALTYIAWTRSHGSWLLDLWYFRAVGIFLVGIILDCPSLARNTKDWFVPR
jgi:hypothetical protein